MAHLHVDSLRPVFQSLYARRFKADIYGIVKTHVELRMMVVDRAGQVVFDSLARHEGEDFSQKRDIHRALEGLYGARTSVDVDGDPHTSVMYVAAPIRVHDEIIGAVSLAKPVQSFGQFVDAARRKTLLVGATSVVAVLLFVVIVSVWLARPFGVVSDYVRWLRAQRSLNLSRLVRRAGASVRVAFDEMRDALAGRNYVADYVQTLTHELKSPLSAIRGAAELLHEPMPDTDRARFVVNIERETQRIQELVDRMMELTALESRRYLQHSAPVALRALLDELSASAQVSGAPRGVQTDVAPGDDAIVEGDAFLLRRALANLVDNALDFSAPGGRVTLSLTRGRRTVQVSVRDHGPGIPEFAGEKVFEKFFSLARPDSRKKSTGLGLAFAKEIAELHDGRVTLANAPDGGALATLTLPLMEDGDRLPRAN